MRSTVPLLVVALVAAPALSGCLTAQATAMQHRPTAQDRARQWDADAELAGVLGIEGSMPNDLPGYWHGNAPDGNFWTRARDDPTVGDGHTEFWIYAWVADGNPDAFFVVVDRDGEVLDSGTTEREEDMVPVGTWGIDSDRALEIAKENNQGLREGLDRENFALMEALSRDPGDDHATWTIAGGGGDASGGGGGFVVLDAVTGDVLQSQGGFGSA